ncbi:MAG: hypothetical protein HOP36_12675 [Methyloglobulus sp.]|nr:hypothetical protein [Methyloglobulus sp.]
MTLNANEIRLVIHLEGGLVQAVYSNSSAPVRVAIQDFDIEGADGDEIAMLDDGTEFLGHIEPIFRNDSHVADVFAAFDEEVPTVDKQQKDYVANKGLICPKCGADDIESTGSVEIDGPIGFGNVECSNCKATWTDQYRIVGFDNLVVEQDLFEFRRKLKLSESIE